VPRLCGNVTNLKRYFPDYLEGFRYDDAGGPVVKAAVVWDSGRGDPAAAEADLAGRVASRVYPFPVHFCAIRHEIEAWLLADEEAITGVARSRGLIARHAPHTGESPEELVHPKERLRDVVLRECGLGYTPAVCGEIAARMNLDQLRHRCPSFVRFEEKLHDC
jgi:Domain of unknown function (DUF4276)